LLQRASNLLTSNGHSGKPVTASSSDSEVFIMDRDESTSESNVTASSSNGFRASIKRKLQGAKEMRLVRSISLRTSTSGSASTNRRRHTRAFSTDSSTTRPQLVHTRSPQSINPSSDHVPRAQSPKPSLQPQPPPKKLSMADVVVPSLLQKGVPMTKVSASRQKTYVFQLDPDQGQIHWESKKPKFSARHSLIASLFVLRY
jgi:phosphatidylinositol phospholipase C, delta